MTTSLAVRTRPQPAQLTVAGAVPLVRVRPAPQFEPPYDDETAPPAGGHPPAPRPVPEPRRAAKEQGPPDPAVAHPPIRQAGGVPPRIGTGGRAAYRYVALCLEVLEGFRPVGHLRRFTIPAAFDSVADQLARPAARFGHRSVGETPVRRVGEASPARRPAGMPARPGPAPVARGTARPQPGAAVQPRPGAAVRPAPGGIVQPPSGAGARPQPGAIGRDGADRIKLRHLRVCEPRQDAVEAVAVLGRCGRAWALALRLERRDGAWLCTHVEIV